MSLPSLVTLSFFTIAAVIITNLNILCIGIQPSVNRTWTGWRNNNNAPLTGSQLNVHSESTTPWPALGERRNQRQNAPQTARTTNQPMWIRPNNGPNWVRNTPPSRNTASISNTNFLNNERGGLPSEPNQRPNSNKPVGISGVNFGQTNSGGVSQNVNSNTNKNAMRVSPSPMQPSGGQNLLNNQNNNAMKGVTNSGQPNGGGGKQNLNNYGNNNINGVVSAGSTVSNKDAIEQSMKEETQNEGNVEDYELREFSEELLIKDTNNAARYVTVNLQGMTTSRSTKDEAPKPLLTIDSKAYSLPSIEKLMLLYNNYILEANQNEVYTAQEKIEENNLLDTILSTSVLQHTRNFLIKKGKIGKDPKEFKDLLRSIWFGMYSRGQGRIGSSGFEHVFLAELKNNQVSGLHNWLYFNEEEKKNGANYLGYMRKVDLGTKGSILKYHFTFHDVDKPVGSMFIGTSPELEIALYSTCFILRADRVCPLKMGGNKFIIRTYTYRYRGKNMIGSAFPEI